MKPIQKAFKLAGAAACLVNEWRDTLLSIGLINYAAFQALYGDPASGVHHALQWMGYRELVRGVAWENPLRLRLVGDVSDPTNKSKNALASAVVGFSVLVLASVGGSPDVGALVLGTIATVFLKGVGRRLRDIPNLYSDKETGMWDWPRKNKNKKGPTQTQKAKDAFKKASSALPKSLVPQSAQPSAHAVLVPVTVPAARKSLASTLSA